jgi:hypothetical protein
VDTNEIVFPKSVEPKGHKEGGGGLLVNGEMVFHIEEIAVNGSLDERLNPVINIARKSGNVLRSGLGDHQALEIHQEFSLLIRNQAVATTVAISETPVRFIEGRWDLARGRHRTGCCSENGEQR